VLQIISLQKKQAMTIYMNVKTLIRLTVQRKKNIVKPLNEVCLVLTG